jgi:dihydroorotate dehydrogenase
LFRRRNNCISLVAIADDGQVVGYAADATAVQIYTGFIYEGPAAVKRINQGLLRLMARDGFQSITEAVGTETQSA